MIDFKFFKENKLYTGNIYEEMIVSIYKYCEENHLPFIGYTHSFTMVSVETITMIDFVHSVIDGIIYIHYDLTTNNRTYRHTFRIPVNEFETAINR